MQTVTSLLWKDRLQASGIHLGLSLVVALLAALLVFGLWYPYPYRDISGGRELFLLLVVVDVILGPLITLAVFNRAKPWAELRRDLVIVVVIQLAALGYGLWTVFAARPVHMVFEYDRFRVVHAVDIPVELLHLAPRDVVALPLTGPTLLSLRPFRDGNEKMAATLAALEGLSLSARPDLWQPYAAAKSEIRQAAKSIVELKAKFPLQATAIDAVIAKAGHAPESMVYTPMVGRKSFWTVFLDPATAEVVAFMPLDSF
ncbi:MAG: TfpX/TfpZ family type IV pilin accessory protein [Rhodoferax sp.]|uniref:TfpX/TfpZ family type IV pilin accessory protein n=1 Tax=Rhodoferax sp. TaxID=50421 RepID=UPI00261867C9|nr:TfpX/TfpZ family type IV pilin accessory protein [Rhodoferax sp.]MDD2881989.1 TfpX/TfpZ family type IV pilin accessory protein [Rhodoferax sp.]